MSGRVLARALAVAACFTLILIGCVWTASAFIPGADRTMRAIAQVNRSSGRSQALQLELTMRIGGRPPVARGEMISHPSGLARLELRGRGGRVERYLLSGSELLAAKNGVRLERPRQLLQPFFLLQPSSETTLRAALSAFDVRSDSIGLATCEEQDCFVIGDPRLAAPLVVEEETIEVERFDVVDALADPLEEAAGRGTSGLGDGFEPLGRGGGSLLDGPELAIAEDALLPRLWVDTADLQVRRIDRASGVHTIFGPIVSFEKLLIPAWFEIREPGQEPVRFDVGRAVQVNAPPKAFSRGWVMEQTGPLPASPEGSPGGPTQPEPSANGSSAPGGTPRDRSSRPSGRTRPNSPMN